MKKELERMPQLREIQEEMLKFWKENKTFEKCVSLLLQEKQCSCKAQADTDNLHFCYFFTEEDQT